MPDMAPLIDEPRTSLQSVQSQAMAIIFFQALSYIKAIESAGTNCLAQEEIIFLQSFAEGP